jgi:hypothetical protein
VRALGRQLLVLLVLLPVVFLALAVDPRSGQAYAQNVTLVQAKRWAPAGLRVMKYAKAVTPVGAVSTLGWALVDTYGDDLMEWANSRNNGNGTEESSPVNDGGCKPVVNWAFGRGTPPTSAPALATADKWFVDVGVPCGYPEVNMAWTPTCMGSDGVRSVQGQLYRSARRVASLNAATSDGTYYGSGWETFCGDQSTLSVVELTLDIWPSGGFDGQGKTRLVWLSPTVAADFQSSSTITCRNAAGATATKTVTGTGTAVRTGGCQDILPDGWVNNVVANGGLKGGQQGELFRGDMNDLSQYPQCLTSPGCEMEVYVEGQNCTTSKDPRCVGWKDKLSQQLTACQWGGYVRALADCDVLRDYYTPTTNPTPTPTVAPSLAPSPAPSPSASTSPQPAPAQQPGRTINPDGSESETTSETLPDGNTRTVTRTKLPDGSTSTRTVVRTPNGEIVSDGTVTAPPFGAGVQDDGGQGCMGSGFSWNPVSWVLTPIRCAFVPSQASTDQINALRAEAGARPPVSIAVWAAGAVPGFGDGFGAATSCTALPDFDPAQLGRARLPCKPDFALYDVGFVLVQLFLVAVTGMYVWGMAQRALQASGGEVV